MTCAARCRKAEPTRIFRIFVSLFVTHVDRGEVYVYIYIYIIHHICIDYVTHYMYNIQMNNVSTRNIQLYNVSQQGKVRIQCRPFFVCYFCVSSSLSSPVPHRLMAKRAPDLPASGSAPDYRPRQDIPYTLALTSTIVDSSWPSNTIDQPFIYILRYSLTSKCCNS